MGILVTLKEFSREELLLVALTLSGIIFVLDY